MLPLSLPPPCVCARVPRCALAPSSSKASGPPRSACPWRPALSNREHPPVTPERRDLPERCLAFARATWLLHAQRSNPLVWCLSWVTSINEKARVKRDCRLAVSYCRSIRARPDSRAGSRSVGIRDADLQRLLMRDREIRVSVDQRFMQRRFVLGIRFMQPRAGFHVRAFLFAQLAQMQPVRFGALAHLGERDLALGDGLLALLHAEHPCGLFLLQRLQLLLQLLVLAHELSDHLLCLRVHIWRQLLVDRSEEHTSELQSPLNL